MADRPGVRWNRKELIKIERPGRVWLHAPPYVATYYLHVGNIQW